ncbi:hypothetical protein GE09DRAFT_1216330 [Coniochaeta sp. 2T2.1]|nr:hypothetical protein GE09DRAFT_1216330 [Coniochaeta sp. 2T2.1]
MSNHNTPNQFCNGCGGYTWSGNNGKCTGSAIPKYTGRYTGPYGNYGKGYGGGSGSTGGGGSSSGSTTPRQGDYARKEI